MKRLDRLEQRVDAILRQCPFAAENYEVSFGSEQKPSLVLQIAFRPNRRYAFEIYHREIGADVPAFLTREVPGDASYCDLAEWSDLDTCLEQIRFWGRNLVNRDIPVNGAIFPPTEG